ncbi:MAG: hypothetical protein JW839_19855 [Candidatus Lokiarchaeota archaeon]|nr:hypothetical protein [Candidatus Lokiarchaeota archaeon]
MDYIGFSIYSKLFLGDRQSLADINATGDDPEAIFPAVAATLDGIVAEFGARHHVGGVVHFCDIEHLFGQDIIKQPWFDAERAWSARRGYPFVLGFHINFSHANLRAGKSPATSPTSRGTSRCSTSTRTTAPGTSTSSRSWT